MYCPILKNMGERRSSRDAVQGELGILREIRRRAAQGMHGRDLRLGIGDDCALIGLRKGEELAVTTDLSIEGRHFRIDWHPPESVGHRTLARGLSDLASMGARPVAAFLSLGLPRDLTLRKRSGRSWIDRFFDGFFRLANACKTPLAGGDLAESTVAAADIMLLGAVPAGQALRRSGARPGDLLYVTGRLGGAAAELAKLAASTRQPHKHHAPSAGASSRPHLYPQPRIVQGLALQRRRLASAAIDLSDGLSTDLAHLSEESCVGAVIETGLLPLAEGASLEHALHGGEDYELLFAARPNVLMPRSIAGVPLTRIGKVTKLKPGKPAVLTQTGAITEPLQARGWQHFA